MMQWGMRALVLVYLILPVAAVIVGVSVIRDITGTLVPVYENASERIGDAMDGMKGELDDLRENFEPLRNAMNRVRNAFSIIRNFVNNSVNRVIDFVNRTPGINIPRFDGIDLPDVLSFSFLSDIADHFSDIKDEFDDATAATRAFIGQQAQSLGLIGALLLGWFLISHLLGAVVVVRSLWR